MKQLPLRPSQRTGSPTGSGTGYPWSPGDQLFAADLNYAIANAVHITSGALQTTGGTMTGPLITTATGGTVARAEQDRAADYANALDFGADPTGGLDSAPAINAAAQFLMAHAGYKDVYLPAGKYYIRSPITLNNQTLFGDGRMNTIIAAGSDFSPTATGIIIFAGGTGSGSCGVRDLRIDMTTPLDATTTASAAAAIGATTITLASAANVHVNDYVWNTTNAAAIASYTLVTNVAGNVITVSPAVASPGVSSGDTMVFSPSRARFQTLANGGTTGFAGNSGCMYPPVINANGAGYFDLRDMWITGAWDGVLQTQASPPTGGAHIHNVCISAFNRGLNFDNLVDFMSISDFRFGGFTMSNVHAGQRGGTFMDGQTIGAQFGRIDGMVISNAVFWQGSIVWTANAVNSQDPHVIKGMVTDGAVINITNSPTVILSGLTMIGSAFGMSTTVPLITVAGGRVIVTGGSYAATTSEAAPLASITGGSLTVSGGGSLANDGLTQGVVSLSGNGYFSMVGGSLVKHSGSATTAPLITQSGTGSLVLKSVSFGGGITGAKPGVVINTANVGHDIEGCTWTGYTLTMPGGVAAAVNNSILYNTPGSYTYIPTPGVKNVRVLCVGAGGGGGGGAQTASGTAASGGGGGGGGAYLDRMYRIGDISTTNNAVNVGQGGTGGAAATTASTAGSNGAAGGQSLFAGGGVQIAAGGGGGQGGAINAASGGGGGGSTNAAGGNGSGGTGGTGGTPGGSAGGSGAAAADTSNIYGGGGGGGSNAAATNTGNGGYTVYGGPGGGSGGGVTATPGTNGGGPSRYASAFYDNHSAGGSAGTPNGGTNSAGRPNWTGAGGGGGFGNSAGSGGNGGVGSNGGGGGGGGSALNGSAAGTGGNGGNGFVFIEELF